MARVHGRWLYEHLASFDPGVRSPHRESGARSTNTRRSGSIRAPQVRNASRLRWTSSRSRSAGRGRSLQGIPLTMQRAEDARPVNATGAGNPTVVLPASAPPSWSSASPGQSLPRAQPRLGMSARHAWRWARRCPSLDAERPTAATSRGSSRIAATAVRDSSPASYALTARSRNAIGKDSACAWEITESLITQPG